MKKQTLYILAGIGIAAAAAGAAYVIYKKKQPKLTADDLLLLESGEIPEDVLFSDNSSDSAEKVCFNCADNTTLSYDDALAIVTEIAETKFGSDAFVVSASDKKAIYTNICGVRRACYMFGADSNDFMNGTMRGFYHIDAETGEVFEGSADNLTQIR